MGNSAIWSVSHDHAILRSIMTCIRCLLNTFQLHNCNGSSLALNLAFPCGLLCLQVYKELWNPRLNEKLDRIHEENNPHDRYAVAAIRETVSQLTLVVLGHLPREISKFTRFIILHGATVKVKVSDTKYGRSPLIEGGLEIPIEVEVHMEN